VQPAEGETPAEAADDNNAEQQSGEGANPDAPPTNNPEPSGEGEKPEPTPTNLEPPAEPKKKSTRRPRRGNGTKKPMTEWGKDLNNFMSDGLLIANALMRIKQGIAGSPPDKQTELRKKVTSAWLEPMEEGNKAFTWICDWANEALDEKVDKDIQEGRVVITPAQASQQNQPEA
jgi:hypothetical protein